MNPTAVAALFGISMSALWSLSGNAQFPAPIAGFHRVFGPARLDIKIKDRFGRFATAKAALERLRSQDDILVPRPQPITPREWFLVPLFVIDEAIERIRDGTIAGYAYGAKTVSLRCAAGS